MSFHPQVTRRERSRQGWSDTGHSRDTVLVVTARLGTADRVEGRQDGTTSRSVDEAVLGRGALPGRARGGALRLGGEASPSRSRASARGGRARSDRDALRHPPRSGRRPPADRETAGFRRRSHAPTRGQAATQPRRQLREQGSSGHHTPHTRIHTDPACGKREKGDHKKRSRGVQRVEFEGNESGSVRDETMFRYERKQNERSTDQMSM